jgi:hypothetical protein
VPRPKKTADSDTQPSLPPSKTSHLFQGRKPVERGGPLTRERLAEHMEAFRKAGGAIEVLGTTRSLQRIGEPAAAPATAPAAPAPTRKHTR